MRFVAAGTTPDLPCLDRAALTALMAIFPPRCKRPGESEEDHQRYAGRVELIERLRAIFDAAHLQGEGAREDDEFNHQDGERAGA